MPDDEGEGGGGDSVEETVEKPAAPEPNAELEAIKSQNNAYAAKQREMENQIAVLAARSGQQHQPQHQQAQLTPEQLKERFYEDPVGNSAAMADRAAQQRAYQAQQQMHEQYKPMLEATQQMVRRNIRESDPEVFDAFESEIAEQVQVVPEHLRGHPLVWENAFANIKGKHFDKVAEIKAKTKKLRQGGPAAPTAPHLPPAGIDIGDLTAEDKKLLAKMKMTPEDFKTSSEQLDKDGNRYTSKEGAFDKLFTYDSTQPSPRSPLYVKRS